MELNRFCMLVQDAYTISIDLGCGTSKKGMNDEILVYAILQTLRFDKKHAKSLIDLS